MIFPDLYPAADGHADGGTDEPKYGTYIVLREAGCYYLTGHFDVYVNDLREGAYRVPGWLTEEQHETLLQAHEGEIDEILAGDSDGSELEEHFVQFTDGWDYEGSYEDEDEL